MGELSRVTKILISTLFQAHETFKVVIISNISNSIIHFRGCFEDSIEAIATTTQDTNRKKWQFATLSQTKISTLVWDGNINFQY